MQTPELTTKAALGTNCPQCRGAIRPNDAHWYGTADAGPYCTAVCMKAAGRAGSLPDYVVEHRPPGPLTDYDLNAVFAVDNPPPGCEAKL